MAGSRNASDSASVGDSASVDESVSDRGSSSEDDRASGDALSQDQWGFWEDVVLFGGAFFGTLSVLWLLPYYLFVLDLLAGLLVGTVAVFARRLGHLERITDDGGTRFFQASALVMLAPYGIAAPTAALGFGDVVSMPIVKFGCVLAGVLAGTVWYRH